MNGVELEKQVLNEIFNEKKEKASSVLKNSLNKIGFTKQRIEELKNHLKELEEEHKKLLELDIDELIKKDETLIITYSGNVGVGTVNPNDTLCFNYL